METEVAHRVCHAACSLYAPAGGKDDAKKHDIQTDGEYIEDQLQSKGTNLVVSKLYVSQICVGWTTTIVEKNSRIELKDLKKFCSLSLLDLFI